MTPPPYFDDKPDGSSRQHENPELPLLLRGGQGRGPHELSRAVANTVLATALVLFTVSVIHTCAEVRTTNQPQQAQKNK